VKDGRGKHGKKRGVQAEIFPKALSLPCLWMAQYQEGYISVDAIEEISKLIDTPPMEIYRPRILNKIR
jgi:NADH:ubiquinone oxidoreductase subunit E